MTDVTRILSAIEQGDHSASDQLLPLVYDELRKLAAAKIAQEAPSKVKSASRQGKCWADRTCAAFSSHAYVHALP
jgi:hypothetical protein